MPIYDQTHIVNALSGMMGADFITGTGVHAPTTPEHYLAIQVISDAVFTSLVTAGPAWGGDAISITVFPAGVTFFGKFTSIQLASGVVIAYKAQ